MSWLRSKVKAWLLRHNMVLSRPAGQFALTFHRLARMRDRGLRLNVAVDGGAAVGDWTRGFREVYPDCRVLCVEPRDDCQDALRGLAQEQGGIEVSQVLLGDRDAEVSFFVHADQSSILPNSRGDAFGQRVTAPMTTLDALVARMRLPSPDLVKLDLQGAELVCLSGAPKCLAGAQAVWLEASFIAFQQSMPLAAECLAFMQSAGYQLYDITALWHRPLDGALAQGDFFFLRHGHPLLNDRRWSVDAHWA